MLGEATAAGAAVAASGGEGMGDAAMDGLGLTLGAVVATDAEGMGDAAIDGLGLTLGAVVATDGEGMGDAAMDGLGLTLGVADGRILGEAEAAGVALTVT